MGLELIALGVTLAVTAAATAYALYQSRKGNKATGQPPGMEAFNPTMASEGGVIWIIYGRVRIPGNIIWWGDLHTEAIEEEVEGGKGGGGGKATTGHRFYVSCWQGICMGQIVLIATYVNDKLETIEATNVIFNDGTQNTYPSNVPNASRLPGVAHIYYDGWYIGDNASTIPTVHFVVERVLPGNIVHANLATGSNPAAVIYDLLIQSGMSSDKIDTGSFNTAATYFQSKGIGLNYVFDSQVEVHQAIERVLNDVDVTLFINNVGRFALKVLDPAESPKITIDQDDIEDLSLNRKTWVQVPNDFHATYVDAAQDFSQRTVIAQNPAAIRLAGNRVQNNLDMKCFRDYTTASKRLFELMKRQSYPAAEIKFRSNLALSTLLPGDVIRIEYPDWGILGADFRVTNIDMQGIEKNEVSIEATQMSETLFDDVFVDMGGTSWEVPDTSMIALTKAATFELPHNYISGKSPTYVMLCAREKLFETGFVVMYSNSPDSDYTTQGLFAGFSQYGVIDVTYPNNTYQIDDTVGILFTPYKNDPQFISISRSDLFNRRRVIIAGNEMMSFQTILPEGANSYRIRGIIRGVLNSPIENHPSGQAMWITELSDRNMLQGVNASTFYLKYLPTFNEKVLDPSLVSALTINYAAKAITPKTPGRIVATRTGTSVAIKVYPLTTDKKGAGTEPQNVYIVPGTDPYPIEGDLEVNDGTTTTYQTSTNFNLTLAGTTTVTVKHRINGRLSTAKQITVGSIDGTYYA